MTDLADAFTGGLEALIVKANAERDARLTFEEARERMLSAIEGARQGHVTPTSVNGDLFGDDPDEREHRMVNGVRVVALKDFNDALDKAFPLPDLNNSRAGDSE